jgi:hypothetical protein
MWLHVPNLSPDSLSAPASADSNSDSGSPSATPIALFAMSSGTPSARPLSWRGWKTRPYIQRLSGTISRPSTAARGVESWISSLAATRASRSAPPDSAAARTTLATSGPTSGASSNPYVLPSLFSRTSPTTSTSASSRSPSTYKTWAIALRRACLRRRKSAPRTSASGCSSWPTPHSNCTTGAGTQGRDGGLKIQTAVANWPTPSAVVANDREQPGTWRARSVLLPEKHRNGNGAGTPLTIASIEAVQRWATPTTRDHKDGACAEASVPTNALLGRQAARWQTPSVADVTGGHLSDSGARSSELLLNGQSVVVTESSRPDPEPSTSGAASSPPDPTSRRRLNPLFAEWLMGWPAGWTDPDIALSDSPRWETASCRSLRRSLSSLSTAA